MSTQKNLSEKKDENYAEDSNDKFHCLKLKNQLCFPLYAASKEILRKYTPLLKKLNLTYTQYIAMMVLWEHRKLNIGELGKHLFLDTGTLSPLLKSMEKKGLVTRTRNKDDERIVFIETTKKGEKMKEKALEIPEQMETCVNLSKKEVENLYALLYKILGKND
ncbi:MAG: MarR family winged helix-turn-helix transcriptional regulator [Treponema sp.]